jgi:hypothetical protein
MTPNVREKLSLEKYDASDNIISNARYIDLLRSLRVIP